MKLFSKMLTGLLTVSLSVGVCSLFPAEAAVTDPVALVESMGMGWNLGNTFDSSGVAAWASSGAYVDTETGWGNKKTTPLMINEIKAAGFDTIRIPVTWIENMDASGNIDTDYLARIKEVVDYCMDAGLYAMLNVHGDGYSSVSGGWLYNGTSVKARFTTMWKQIATYFKDYGQTLAFAGWNEIEYDYSTHTAMAQAFVDTVRAVGGGNSNRLLIIPGINTDLTKSCDSQFTMPTDAAKMLAVELHYYSPPQFCVAEQGTSWGYASTWGTDAEVTALKNDINKMNTNFVAKGYPVIIGECGVLTGEGKDAQDIRDWLKKVFEQSLGYEGICPVLWDTSGHGDMNFFDRENLTWFDTQTKAIFNNMAGVSTETATSFTYDADLVYKPADPVAETGEYWMLDISPYYGLCNITGVKVAAKGIYESGAKDPCFGVTMECNGYLTAEDPMGDYTWFCQQISYGADADAAQMLFNDGMSANEVEYTQEGVDWHLSYDYLKFESWWKNNVTSFVIDSITVYFDKPIVIPDAVLSYADPDTDTTTTTSTTTTTTTTSTSVVTAGKHGDVNCDNSVDIADAILLSRYVAEDTGVTVSDQGLLNANVDGDTMISSGDVTAILKFIAKLLPSI